LKWALAATRILLPKPALKVSKIRTGSFRGTVNAPSVEVGPAFVEGIDELPDIGRPASSSCYTDAGIIRSLILIASSKALRH
jgi:hypothetical protein